MGKKKKQTVGFRYYFGVHMGIARAIDELVRIKVSDSVAWSGSVSANTTISINKPELFGGDDREGGIKGPLVVLMGAADQSVHGRLASMLGGLVPAFRGVATVFFDGLMCSGSPYPKPWSFRVRRATSGWDGAAWYVERAVIWMASSTIRAMNPAHLLYECWTNPSWGRGVERARLDDTAWRAAADRLFTEGFGLCMKWARTDSIEAFMQFALDHIGAVQYVDRTTGLIVLKLIRDDYTVGALPHFDASTGLLGIDDDSAGAQSAATNEVIVNYVDPVTGDDRSVRVKNTGAIHAGFGVASATKEYPGLPTGDLARRVALRDLRAASGFIKRYKVRLDRRAYALMPGAVFRISDPTRGISNMVLRAGRVEHGTLTDGTVTVTALQDVFGLPATTYVAEQPGGWLPPDATPQPVALRRLIEVPYRDLAQTVDAANLGLIAGTAGYVAVIAAKPTSMSLDFDLLTRVGSSGAFSSRDDGAFCPSGTLTAAISPTTTSITVTDSADLAEVAVGTAAFIDDEIVRIDYVDADTGAVTIARGCADTVPAPHSAGARIWFYDDFSGADPTEYSVGMTIQARLLTRTNAGTLAESSAPTDFIVLAQRQARPYPPGKLLVNGSAYPGSVAGEVTVSWAHRDRLLQLDQLVDTSAGNVGPEAGVTYRLRFYSGATLRRTYSGITGTSQTYSVAHETADGGPFNPLRIVLDCERGGLYSVQAHDVTVSRT